MFNRWKSALDTTMMGSQVPTDESPEPLTATSANFDRAMPQVQQYETPFHWTASTRSRLPPNDVSEASQFAAEVVEPGWLERRDTGTIGTDELLLQLFPPQLVSNPVAACQHLANVLFPPDQGGQPSPLLAQTCNLAATGRFNQDQLVQLKAVSGFKETVQARPPPPSSDLPVVTPELAHSIPGPIAELHRLENGSTFSFAIGTKYRGRRAFQLPAHRIFFDNSYNLKLARFYTTYFPKTPSKSDYPVTGFFELRCSHYSKGFAHQSCPCFIKLRFQLNQIRVPTDEVEFEMVEFVNHHAFHLRGEGVPKIYKPPKIEQEYVKVRVGVPSQSRRSIKQNSDSSSSAAFTFDDRADGSYHPSLDRFASKSSHPFKSSNGYRLAHRPDSNLFPCSKASLEMIRLRLRREVGANVAPSGGTSTTPIRARWVCHVGRGGRPHLGGSQCQWQLVFTSEKDADQWYLCESESHIYHNHSIPIALNLGPTKPTRFDNTALSTTGLLPMLDGKLLPPLSTSNVSHSHKHDVVDEKPSEDLRIEATHRYQERNAPSPEALIRPSLPVLYESQQLIDERSGSKHARSDSRGEGDNQTRFKAVRLAPLAATFVDSLSHTYLPSARHVGSLALPRIDTIEGSAFVDPLETYLHNLAPTFTFRLLETRTQHNLSILAPSFEALDYKDAESIQDLELRDLDDLVIDLRQHFDEHGKGESGGIGLHDWKRIANRLQAALRK